MDLMMKPGKCRIDGVAIFDLAPHDDSRGRFTELFRANWATGPSMIQWNCVRSRPGVLRGVHVHAVHHDYLVMVDGTMMLGLHDLRVDSPTFGRSEMLVAKASEPAGFAIPPGVCHGFYFPEPSVHVYSVSEYWNIEDELGCRFDCPELGLEWPGPAPILSSRDAQAGGYADMRQAYERARSRRV
jgi:dTDP-4-dehydrorhamnose 3,5-epimerase